MSKIAVISSILEEPTKYQKQFNEVVASFRGSIRGRMGLPLDEGVSVISITVTGDLDDINSLTNKLDNIEGVMVKTVISKKEI